MNQYIFPVLTLLTCTNGYYHRDIGIPEAKRIKKAEETALTSRIVGGHDVYPTQYPFFAGLIIAVDVNMTSVCGASIISDEKLLTAAHCWYDGESQPMLIEVVLGSTMLFYGGTRVLTNDVVIHPDYDEERMHNDIAIITTPKVEFTKYIQPIHLPTEQMHENIIYKVIGFGRINDGTPLSINQHLSQIKLNVITNAECALTFGQLITDSLICTSGNGFIGPCGGDSGGPMFYRSGKDFVLIGVVSFGSSYGCEAGHPTSYTRVTSFLDWIQSRL